MPAGKPMMTFFKTAIAAVIFGFLIFSLWQVPGYPQNPVGCDPFGYQRQAELFRTEGLAGFDTALTIPAGPALLEVARGLGLPPEQWSEAVAPHCHHYVARTDKVILQYPVGTGALMALFPGPAEERALRITSVAAIVLIFFFLLSQTSSLLGIVVVAALASETIDVVAAEAGSPSVWPAVAAATAIGVLMALCFRHPRRSLLLALGVLIGLSVSIRLSNGLFAVGPVAVLLLNWARYRNMSWLRLTFWMLAGLAIGSVPLLYANFVDAGSVFATTYGTSDAAPPHFSLPQLTKAIAFYFSAPKTGAYLLVSILLLLIAAVVKFRSHGMLLLSTAMIVAISLMYFLNKDILITYYLEPTAALILAVVAANWAFAVPEAAPAHRGLWLAAAALPVVALTGFVCATLPKVGGNTEVDPAVAARLADKPMVWANVSTGYFVLLSGVYSAKLVFADASVQDRLVAGLFEAHVPQLFVVEDDPMTAIITRLSKDWSFASVGSAYGKPVLELLGPVAL